ncbi:MAG: response regulator [Bacteroidales bacterium]|nr:response regulator [Bacteroidales bacterium]MCF8327538.1 response regulator [Bacteroidales bacterium]
MDTPPLIFVVDDDELIHKLIRSILNKLSLHNINHLYSGEECISHLHKSPDLILLDFEMRGINGLETLDKIKSNNPGVPVYMISGQKEFNTAIKAIQKGAEDYFTKDCNLSKNLEKVISSSKLSA